MTEELLSIKEMWTILGQRWTEDAPALSTVKQWARDGRFPGARIIGNSYVIPRAALDGFERPKRGRPRKAADK